MNCIFRASKIQLKKKKTEFPTIYFYKKTIKGYIIKNSSNKYNINSELLETLINNGPDYIQEPLRIRLNEAMRMERI